MGLVETIERKRAEFIADQNKKGYGTFSALAEAIKRKKMAAMQAADKPTQEKSNAK